jgi:hypothetical protein
MGTISCDFSDLMKSQRQTWWLGLHGMARDFGMRGEIIYPISRWRSSRSEAPNTSGRSGSSITTQTDWVKSVSCRSRAGSMIIYFGKREGDASALNSKIFRCSLVCIRDNQQSGPYCQGSRQQNHFKKIQILFSIWDCSRGADSGMLCSKVNWLSWLWLLFSRRYLDF